MKWIVTGGSVEVDRPVEGATRFEVEGITFDDGWLKRVSLVIVESNHNLTAFDDLYGVVLDRIVGRLDAAVQ